MRISLSDSLANGFRKWSDAHRAEREPAAVDGASAPPLKHDALPTDDGADNDAR